MFRLAAARRLAGFTRLPGLLDAAGLGSMSMAAAQFGISGAAHASPGAAARNAQQSVVALDIIALMDALKIEQAVLAAYDWGARTANIIAALWPQRCKARVSVNGYLMKGAGHTLPQEAPQAFADAVLDVARY